MRRERRKKRMQGWIDSVRGAWTQAVLRALRANVAHNRSALPPFRLPQVAEQIVAGLVEFVGSRDPQAAGALGERLASQGLGLRALLAAMRALARHDLAEAAAGEPGAVAHRVEDF